MRSTNWLLNSLRTDFSEFTFTPGTYFLWSSHKKTISFDPDIPNSSAYLLHELSHALLNHQGYERDIELLKLERDAWNYTQTTLAPRYNISIDYDLVQDNLDTYRSWLHARSLCPECDTTGLQTKQRHYTCVACGHIWRVNEARLCALRRYSLATK
jgi:hypothetical protein